MGKKCKRVIFDFADSGHYAFYAPLVPLLNDFGDFDVSICSPYHHEPDRFHGEADIYLSLSSYPQVTSQGHVVLLHNWSIPGNPSYLISGMNNQADAVWIVSSPTAKSLIHYGLHPDLVRIVPVGIDLQIFKSCKPMLLPTTKKFKFLFIGTIVFDDPMLLVDAYLKAFTENDAVCLILRADLPYDFVYSMELNQIRAGNPEIIILKDPIPHDEMPALYSACNCLVHIYEQEAQGLQMIEAMACGVPVMTLNFEGPADYCTDENSFLIPYSIVRKPFQMAFNSGIKLLDYSNLPKLEMEQLSSMLRFVYEHPEALDTKKPFAPLAIQSYQWEQVAIAANQYLLELSEKPIKRHFIEQVKNQGVEGLKRGIEMFPESSDLHHLMARHHLQNGSHQEALQEITLAMQYAPLNPENFQLFGALCWTLGKREEALDHLVRSILMEPRIHDYWKNLLNILPFFEQAKVLNMIANKLQEGNLKEGLGVLPSTVEKQYDFDNFALFRQHVDALHDQDISQFLQPMFAEKLIKN